MELAATGKPEIDRVAQPVMVDAGPALIEGSNDIARLAADQPWSAVMLLNRASTSARLMASSGRGSQSPR